MLNLTYDAVIVAGGEGTRLGAHLPKAFVPIGNKPMVLHSLEQFDMHSSIHSIILVVPEEMIGATEKLLSSVPLKKIVTVIKGGKERWLSVKNGVEASKAAWVLIHDAARPFVTHAVIDAVLEQSKNYTAVITAIKEVDTVRRFSGDRALETIDRETLIRVGTPQLFLKSELLQSFSAVEIMKIAPTDEAMLMEHFGIPVGIAWGDPLNFTVTTPSDLLLAEALYKRR
jgi:2-C-methyl-D-erythritol 4-phosphate cytidylyltransferase